MLRSKNQRFRELCVGEVASWLVSSSPDRVVLVQALTGRAHYCVVFLGKVYNWEPPKLMFGGNPVMD